VIVYRRLAGIAFGQELQHDTISEIARKRNVRLKRNSLALGPGQQIAKSRNGRITPIGAYQNANQKCVANDIDLPITVVRLVECDDG
jgi:hypothetical protein